MDNSQTMFSFPFVDSANGEHTLSGNLLENYEFWEQFLSADEPLEEPDLNGPTTLHCEICRKKFDNAPKYYGHLRVHSKDKLWICDQCPDERFSTKQQLMKHSLTHKPLERVWKCPQCPMAFESLWALQQHLFAKHLGFRPHKCNTCQKSFQKLSDLQKHQMIHKKISQFSCSVCSRSFSDVSNLNRHMVLHTKEKNFVCTKCKRRFTQLASLRRHAPRCRAGAMPPLPPAPPAPATRQHHCRVCGHCFQYKGELLEHCVRYHTTHIEKEPDKDERSLQNAENKTVETIVDDILSVEDEYSIVNTNRMAETDVHKFLQADERTNDNLMHIEFLKDMNQLHTLDDELFYNDLDFDSFQNNQEFTDVLHSERNPEILFDFDASRSIDQDLMNALCQAKAENMPDFIQDPTFSDTTDNLLGTPDSNNYCATIFESDVDLEASTSLAMNLNQLIGENNVRYVETEEGDTFIISVDEGVDTEKLTDILNIGVGMGENNEASTPMESNQIINEIENNEINNTSIGNNDLEIEITRPLEFDKESEVNQYANLSFDSHLVLKIDPAPAPIEIPKEKENMVVTVTNVKDKVKKKAKVVYLCKICDKVFKRKDNYRSHRGTHNESLRRHGCPLCGEWFSYHSTLAKHVSKAHSSRPPPSFNCDQCPKQYKAQWMVNDHKERDHGGLKPYKCEEAGCASKFYKKCDLELHKRRIHLRSRPFACGSCSSAFAQRSHLLRHQRALHPDKKTENKKESKTKSSSAATLVKVS